MNKNRKPYIVTNAAGVEYLLPTYPQTFRALMDDKETVKDVLNSLLHLEKSREIVDLEYQFEKNIDVFMPGAEPIRLDAWISTKDNRFINVELQNRLHPFFSDRMQLYNAYLTIRSKHDYNESEYFKSLPEDEKKTRYYELPETVSIWLCNFPILKSPEIYRDSWSVFSEHDVKTGATLPIFPKNKYIVVDLPKFIKLHEGVDSREAFWLRLLSKGPLGVPETEDPLFAGALDRLRVSVAKPELIDSLEAYMFDERHAEEAIIAEAYLNGKAKGEADGHAEGLAKGLAEGRAKGLAEGRAEGLAKGRADGKREMARALKAMGDSTEKIVAVSGLTPAEVEAL